MNSAAMKAMAITNPSFTHNNRTKTGQPVPTDKASTPKKKRQMNLTMIQLYPAVAVHPPITAHEA